MASIQIEDNEIIEASIIIFEDVKHSLEKMKPSVSKDDLKKYKDFTDKFCINN